MNNWFGTGRLTKKPEIRYTRSEKAVCDFSIAVNREYTKEDGTRDVDYINCQVWGKPAESLVKYQDKGNLLAVFGNLRIDQYQDDKGQNRYKTYILCQNIEYLSPKNSTSSNSNQISNPINKSEKPSADVFAAFGNQINLESELPF